MKVFFKLVKIYLASVFSLKNLKAQIQKQKKKNGETITKNSKAKIIGIVFLFVIIFAEFLFFFGMYAYGLYAYAKEAHNLKLLFELSAALVSVISLFFGFLVTASTYYIGEIEEQFLSMPIKHRTLFSAKFTANTINSILASLAFFSVLMVIFGINENPHFLFYIWGVLCAVVIPLPVIAFCYFFNILLMRFTRFFKNKNVIMGISSAIGIILSLAFNYFIQSMPNNEGFDALTEKIASGATGFAQYGVYYPPVRLVGKILTEPNSIITVLYLILLIAVCTALPVLIIFFMSKMYCDSLIGFGEKKIKKLDSKEVSGYIKKNIKTLPPLAAYVKREFVMMNRTPIYLLNGPFTIIFLPILFIVIFIAKNGNFDSIPPVVLDFMNGNAGFVIAGLIAGVLGSMSNIADTALSRDAKFIPVVKSLPIDIQMYMYAKLIHSMIFALFAVIIGVGFIAFIFKFSLINIIFASLTALVFSGVLNLLALFVDTAHPKLHWDNPVAAMKQNTNVLFVMLFNFIILGLSSLVLFFAINAYTWVLLIYFVFIPGAIFAVLIKPYGIYAEKKMAAIEL